MGQGVQAGVGERGKMGGGGSRGRNPRQVLLAIFQNQVLLTQQPLGPPRPSGEGGPPTQTPPEAAVHQIPMKLGDGAPGFTGRLPGPYHLRPSTPPPPPSPRGLPTGLPGFLTFRNQPNLPSLSRHVQQVALHDAWRGCMARSHDNHRPSASAVNTA